MVIHWRSRGREELDLELHIDGGNIVDVTLRCLGSLQFLRTCQTMKAHLSGPVDALVAPKGHRPWDLIWREVVGKIQGAWALPVENQELCHCRRISTAAVDEAIVYGAHTPEALRKQTSANTGCGTCLPDIEALLKNRL